MDVMDTCSDGEGLRDLGDDDVLSSSPPPPTPPTVLGTPMVVDQPQSPLSPQTHLDLPFLDTSHLVPREPSPKYLKERDICMDYFSSWTEQDQIEFVEELLKSMQHHQHGTVNAFLKPMLQRDFISLLPKKVNICPSSISPTPECVMESKIFPC